MLRMGFGGMRWAGRYPIRERPCKRGSTPRTPSLATWDVAASESAEVLLERVVFLVKRAHRAL